MISVTVKAPSSTANLGPGFDIFGLALDAFYDKITLRKIKNKEIIIKTSDTIPINPTKNTAGLVAKAMFDEFKIKGGVEIEIKKGVPAGFGMGSSAASAAATAVAFDKLFKLNLDKNKLVQLAGIGEKASAGTIHYDNVAASLLGGFVLVKTNPLNVIKLDAPRDLVCCVAIPTLDVPQKKTKVSRGLVPKQIKMQQHIANTSNASAIVAGFAQKDSRLIGDSILDVIVEPARKRMIPGFDKVKKNALKAGALGVTISGAGPSVIAFATNKSNLKKIGKAMSQGFAEKCTIVTCRPSKGAII